MNCREFSEVVSDLARNEGLERAERERALAHADACPRCDEELATARALSSALGVLASSAAGAVAPARVEEFLRREMRQRGDGRVVPMRRATRWVIGGVAGLAAAALLSIEIMKPSIWHHGTSGAAGVNSATETGPVAATQSSPAAVQPVPAAGGADQSGDSFDGSSALNSDTEYATAFVELPSADGAASSEDQTIVRVSLPPSALASFGLPVSADARDTNVLADFVLGEDGMPRAVRLVQAN